MKVKKFSFGLSKHVKFATTLLIILNISACASTAEIVDRGKNANDAAVNSCVFVLCYGASVGAIQRKFGSNPEVWEDLCKPENGFSPNGMVQE